MNPDTAFAIFGCVMFLLGIVAGVGTLIYAIVWVGSRPPIK